MDLTDYMKEGNYGMSKGPGKWGRAILAELTLQESFWLRTLLPENCTKAGYDALLRAAMKLEADGLVNIDRWPFGQNTGEGRTAVRRIGTIRPERLSVGKVLSGNFTHT